MRDSLFVLWLKRVGIAVVCVHVLFSCWSTYRRIWQVLRIDLQASSLILAAGETVSYDVVTSGETHNRILLELVQGTHTETLLDQRAQVNAVNTYDPRVFEYVRTVTITPGHAVTASSVARRTNEIGIRMALGSGRSRVIRTVMSGALGQVSLGLVLGLPLAIGAGWLISTELYGVNPWDPPALTLAAFALGIGSCVAGLIPAERAASISPVIALRAD